MEFFCFLPKWAGLRLQFREGRGRSSARSISFHALPFCTFRNEVEIPFLTLHRQPRNNSRHAGPTANKLFDQRPRHWRPRNNVRKIDYRFAETRRALVQVVSSLRSWLNGLSNYITLAAFIPKGVF